MLVPLILLALAVVLAGVVAYGTEPRIGSFGIHGGRQGVDLILWTRRLQWPLAVTAVLLCIVLIVLVVSGKRRAWWLVGLLPVLALFAHRFISGPAARFQSVDDPILIPADRVDFVSASDEVVGVVRDGAEYAFPYSVLYHNPVAVLSDRAGGLVLLWSPLANRAIVFTAARDVHARDLEVVSSPMDTLLVFNSRLGQFINGVTGRTPDGSVPTGFLQPITATKTSWSDWRNRHPGSLVMSPTSTDWRTAPNQPVMPVYAIHGALPDHRRVCMVAATQPIAVPSEMVTEQPMNLMSGETPILLVRVNGMVRAFSRQLPMDLVLRFKPMTDPKHKSVQWVDADTGSEWSLGGEAVEGPKEISHTRLTALPVEDEVYLGVMRAWYPNLHLATSGEITKSILVDQPPAVTTTKPVLKRKKQAR